MMMLGLLALVLTGCKHETCTLQAINDYSEPIMVLFSEDEKCTEPTQAAYYALIEPKQGRQISGVKEVEKLNAIFFIGVGQTTDGKVAYKRVGSISLKDYAGMAVVTARVFSSGTYGVESSNM